jgi:hypothetical protein
LIGCTFWGPLSRDYKGNAAVEGAAAEAMQATEGFGSELSQFGQVGSKGNADECSGFDVKGITDQEGLMQAARSLGASLGAQIAQILGSAKQARRTADAFSPRVNGDQPDAVKVKNNPLGPDSSTKDPKNFGAGKPKQKRKKQPGEVFSMTDLGTDSSTKDPGNFGAGKPKQRHLPSDQAGTSLADPSLGSDSSVNSVVFEGVELGSKPTVRKGERGDVEDDPGLAGKTVTVEDWRSGGAPKDVVLSGKMKWQHSGRGYAYESQDGDWVDGTTITHASWSALTASRREAARWMKRHEKAIDKWIADNPSSNVYEVPADLMQELVRINDYESLDADAQRYFGDKLQGRQDRWGRRAVTDEHWLTNSQRGRVLQARDRRVFDRRDLQGAFDPGHHTGVYAAAQAVEPPVDEPLAEEPVVQAPSKREGVRAALRGGALSPAKEAHQSLHRAGLLSPDRAGHVHDAPAVDATARTAQQVRLRAAMNPRSADLSELTKFVLDHAEANRLPLTCKASVYDLLERAFEREAFPQDSLVGMTEGVCTLLQITAEDDMDTHSQGAPGLTSEALPGTGVEDVAQEREAVDQAAKDYWEKFYGQGNDGEYGRQLVQDPKKRASLADEGVREDSTAVKDIRAALEIAEYDATGTSLGGQGAWELAEYLAQQGYTAGKAYEERFQQAKGREDRLSITDPGGVLQASRRHGGSKVMERWHPDGSMSREFHGEDAESVGRLYGYMQGGDIPQSQQPQQAAEGPLPVEEPPAEPPVEAMAPPDADEADEPPATDVEGQMDEAQEALKPEAEAPAEATPGQFGI